MIHFKSQTEENEFKFLKSRAQVIAFEMGQFCHERGQEFIITDILSEKREDKLLRRVSTSHQEGRAFDVRTRNWTKEFREEFIEHFSNKFKEWAAISKETLKPKLIVYHDNGNGIHCHVQIRPY